MDEIEDLAINQVTQLYDCEFANVQPHSGVNANTAVYQAFMKPGDVIMGMDLASGGHLSHGAPPTLSGKVCPLLKPVLSPTVTFWVTVLNPTVPIPIPLLF